MLEKLSLVGELEGEDDPLAIVEIGKQPKHMRVPAAIPQPCQFRRSRADKRSDPPEILLDLDLPSDLLLYSVLEDLGLHQAFQRDDVLRALRPRQVDTTELSSSQRFSDFKVGQRAGPV